MNNKHSLFRGKKFMINDFIVFVIGEYKGKYGSIRSCWTDGTYSVLCEGELIDDVKESDIGRIPGEVYSVFLDMLMFQDLIKDFPPEEYDMELIEYVLGFMPDKYSEETINDALSLLRPYPLKNGTGNVVNCDLSEIENVSIPMLILSDERAE